MLRYDPLSMVIVLSAEPWNRTVPCVVMLHEFRAWREPFFTVVFMSMNSLDPSARGRCQSLCPLRFTVPPVNPMRLPL